MTVDRELSFGFATLTHHLTEPHNSQNECYGQPEQLYQLISCAVVPGIFVRVSIWLQFNFTWPPRWLTTVRLNAVAYLYFLFHSAMILLNFTTDCYFVPDILVARSGRSTSTFIKEGLWEKAKAVKPDVVLIQFGHNDSHAMGRPEATDASTDFRDHLRTYVTESIALGATPILVTPMHRRTFNAGGTLIDILKPYADAMKVVAEEKKVALIDLHSMSGELFVRIMKGAQTFVPISQRGGDAVFKFPFESVA